MSGVRRTRWNLCLKLDQPVRANKTMASKINKSIFFFLSGPKFRQRFLCEVRINNFPYVGAGNSTNKKDAEKNASKDYVSFLVRSGRIAESDVPVEGAAGPTSAPIASVSSSSGSGQGSSSGNLSNFSPNQLGQAYRPAQYDNDFGPQSYMDRAQQQARMEEAESLDVNAGIHGNWTIENAKSKLNQFMQSNKIQGEFRYTPVGPDHNRLVLLLCLSKFSFFIIFHQRKILRNAFNLLMAHREARNFCKLFYKFVSIHSCNQSEEK